MTNMPLPTDQPFVDLSRARAAMEADGLDALIASSPRNVLYLSGHVFFDILVEPDASTFAALPAREDVDAFLTVPMGGRLMFDDFPAWPPTKIVYGNFSITGGPPVAGDVAADSVAALERGLHGIGAERSRVGLELDLIPVEIHRRIVEALPGLEIVNASPIFTELRKRKTSGEVERIRRATYAIETAIAEAFANIRVGVAEREIDRWIREGLIRRGAEPVSLSIGTGSRGALVWSWVTDRAVAGGDVVRADITASYGGYCSDLARSCVVGEPTDEQATYYRAAHEAVQTGIATIRAGGRTGEVFDAAMGVARGYGFPDFDRPHVGHGLGLQVHEAPYLSPSGGEIPVDAVLAVECPFYVHDLGGFSSEDVVVVGEAGLERFTYAPSQLPVVG